MQKEPIARDSMRAIAMQNFATGLRAAINLKGLTLKEAASKSHLGVDYDWLRRAVTKGIAFTHSNNDALMRIGSYFGVPHHLLWESGNEFFHRVHTKIHPVLPIEKQVRAVLAYFAARSKPKSLTNALSVIQTYYNWVGMGVVTAEEISSIVEELESKEISKEAFVNLLIEVISEVSAECGADLERDKVVRMAEGYVSRAALAWRLEAESKGTGEG